MTHPHKDTPESFRERMDMIHGKLPECFQPAFPGDTPELAQLRVDARAREALLKAQTLGDGLAVCVVRAKGDHVLVTLADAPTKGLPVSLSDTFVTTLAELEGAGCEIRDR